MYSRILLLALGAAALAAALLWATDAPGADPIGPRFRQAQELMRAGRFAEAEPILRWILRTRPGLVRVQLDHALVLFRLGRDSEAREIFLAVRRIPDLPAQVRRNVEDYLERIRSRDPLHIGLDFGLWHDRNINNASEAETVEIPVFGTRLPFRLNERPQSAWVARTGANLRWRKPVSPRAHIEVTSAVARNSAIGHSEYDRDTASLSVGPRIRYFVGGAGTRPLFGQVNMDVGVRKQWHGGHGYSHTAWVGLGVDQAVAPDWRIGAYASRWVTGYNADAASVEPTGQSLYLGVSRRVGPGWLTVGGRFSGENAKRENRRWAGREASVSYGATLWRDLRVSARATATATLAVDFGDGAATGTVSGEIDGFTANGAAKDWTVALGSARIGTHGAIGSGGTDTALTRWTIGEDEAETTGAWSGQFHEADERQTPTVATGAFDAMHGTIGRMTGAFGAKRRP